MISDLQEFIALLRSEGELVEVHAEVDPKLEAAEIHRRIIAANGPAILFKNIQGSPFPLATNLFGTKKRIELAFGKKPAEFIRAIAEAPEQLLPPTPSKLWEQRGLISNLLRVGLKRTSKGAVTEVVDSPPQLSRLPLLTTWEKDGGAFITLPLVYTEHPTSGVHNLGMYRIQRYNDNETGLHMQIGKGGGFHLEAAKNLGKMLPVNITIGGPPALILSAISPLPENVPELLFASLVMGKKLPLAKNPIGSLPVAANSEFVLVGETDPHQLHPEGPFGDHYGYYSLQHDYPLFRCKGLLRKRNPICAATVVGKPRQEDFYLGDYLQEILAPLISLAMPAVEDLWSYGETGYHSLTAARVKERYKRETMASAFRILGEGQLSLTKFLLVINQTIDLKSFKSVLEHVLERADFRSDLYIFANLSMDTLDYNGPKVNQGSKGVLVGVGDPIRQLPTSLNSDLPNFIEQALIFCKGCLVVEGKSFQEDQELAERIAQHKAFRDWPLIVLVDDAKRAAKSEMNFLWTTFTRFEPASDIYAQSQSVVKNHIVFNEPIVIDARLKPNFPEELFCDEQTSKTVTDRWKEYFPDGQEMGDSGLAHLD